MNYLQVDEIRPYKNNTNEELVRIGVIDRNLLHAVMVAYSDRYLKSTIDKRIETVKAVRDCISNSITDRHWEMIDNNYKLVLNQFIILLQDEIKLLSLHIMESVNLCKIIIEILTSFDIVKCIQNTRDFDELYDSILARTQEFLKDLETNRIDYFTKHIKIFIKALWTQAEIAALTEYKLYIKNDKEPLGLEILPFISNIFNKDICVFDKYGKMLNSDTELKGRQCILLFEIGEKQFETIGRRMHNSDVQWLFESDESLIEKLLPVSKKPRIMLSPLFKKRQPPQLQLPLKPHSPPHTPHSLPHTPHSPPHSPPHTPHTPHSLPHTPYSPPHSPLEKNDYE